VVALWHEEQKISIDPEINSAFHSPGGIGKMRRRISRMMWGGIFCQVALFHSFIQVT